MGSVKAEFNGIALMATWTSKPREIISDYQKKNEDRAEAYRNSPNGQKAAQESENFRKKAEMARTQGILPFSLKDADSWNKFVEKCNDEYSKCTVRYAARWANLMERKMNAGAKLEDIAYITSQEADVEGITGFMHGCAVSILSLMWENGEPLRRWHNISIQLGDEGEKANESGGVLNPAILSIG